MTEAELKALDVIEINKNLIKINKDSIKVNQNLIKIKKSGFSGLGRGAHGA